MDELNTPVATSNPQDISIKALFTQSWGLSLKTILRFIVIGAISMAVGAFLIIIAWVLAGTVLGSMVGLDKLGQLFSGKDTYLWLEIISNQKLQMTAGAILVVYTLLAYAFQSLVSIATILAIDTAGQPFSLSIVLGRAKKVLLPFMLLQMLLGFLYIGSFFFFFIPFLLIMFFLIFAGYELILNGQSVLNALRRSVFLVTKNFGHVFMAILVLLGLQVIFQALPGILGQMLGEKDYGGVLFIFFIFYFIASFIFSWFTTVFMVALYKRIRDVSGNEGKGHVWWMWIVALLGWLILLGIVFFSYKFVGAMIEKAKQPPSSPEASEQLTYVPSSCGVEVGLPATTDNFEGKDRRWLIDEYAANPETFSLLDPKTTPIENAQMTHIFYRDPEGDVEDKDGYFIIYPGMQVICADNTRSLTLETFTGLLQANKNLKVEINKEGVLKTESGVELQGFNILFEDKDGNELRDPGYIGVSEDGEKLIFVNLVSARNEDSLKDQIRTDIKSMITNLRYGPTGYVLPEKPVQKNVTYTQPAAANPQPTIKPGELGSQEWIDNFDKEFAETKKRIEDSRAKMEAQ